MSSQPAEAEINIVDALGPYRPRANYRRLIESMLDVVPAVYKEGLTTIHLKVGSTGNRAERRHRQWRRGRMSRQEEWIGFYQRGGPGRPSSITLIVDRLDESYAWAKSIPLLRTVAQEHRIGKTLYHELGHHIHRTKHRQHAEPENIADDYAVFYLRRYWRQKRPFLRVFMTILLSPLKLLTVIFRKRFKRRTRKPLRMKKIEKLEAEAIAAYEERINSVQNR